MKVDERYNGRQGMRKDEIMDDARAQLNWVAVDYKTGETMLRLHDRELLERVCRSLDWKSYRRLLSAFILSVPL
jgi:hypothetical protein